MNNFNWTEECWQVFNNLKKFLTSLPLLSTPELEEELYLYLATSYEAVSSVLVGLDDKGIQISIYYISRVLHNAKMRYSKFKKIVFILITYEQHLRSYFQVYSVTILIDQLLQAKLQLSDTSRQMAK